MPYGNMPWVRDGGVITAEGKRIEMGTPAWFAWLEKVTAFCYSHSGSAHRLTVRREQRRQQHYWYGYSKVDAKLHNVYLGRSEQLTQARFDRAYRQLLAKVKHEKEVMTARN